MMQAEKKGIVRKKQKGIKDNEQHYVVILLYLCYNKYNLMSVKVPHRKM